MVAIKQLFNFAIHIQISLKTDSLNIQAFNYQLPEEKIAKYPLEQRDASKLLYYREGEISEIPFNGLPGLLTPSDLLVFNNTKVIRARIPFEKSTGAHIEIFCLHPVSPGDYLLAFQRRGSCCWECIVGNLKKWKSGPLRRPLSGGGFLEAILTERRDQSQMITFQWPSELCFAEVLDDLGCTPIPPSLNREAEPIDEKRYQTIYSKWKGSVAAPTAGLHFTGEVLQKIKESGTSQTELTLHVGAGTFKPVQNEKIKDHTMHTEFFSVNLSSLELLLQHHGSIVAVGTTSLRTLESLYWLGVKLYRKECSLQDSLFIDQWYAYTHESFVSSQEILEFLIQSMKKENIIQLQAYTQIMCVPGYTFRMVDQLITNFHQPKSTLLLLVAAFIGKDWRLVYDYALSHRFRFLSYGDSSLLVKSQQPQSL